MYAKMESCHWSYAQSMQRHWQGAVHDGKYSSFIKISYIIYRKIFCFIASMSYIHLHLRLHKYSHIHMSSKDWNSSILLSSVCQGNASYLSILNRAVKMRRIVLPQSPYFKPSHHSKNYSNFIFFYKIQRAN